MAGNKGDIVSPITNKPENRREFTVTGHAITDARNLSHMRPESGKDRFSERFSKHEWQRRETAYGAALDRVLDVYGGYKAFEKQLRSEQAKRR